MFLFFNELNKNTQSTSVNINNDNLIITYKVFRNIDNLNLFRFGWILW